MISQSLAWKLKEAGLQWDPQLHDFFWIPDRALDEKTFVVSDLQANLELYRGWPVVTFHGSAEWALDYILQADVVWLPREEQLRLRLMDCVETLTFVSEPDCCTCRIQVEGERYSFTAPNGSDAYGEALLFALLQQGMREGNS